MIDKERKSGLLAKTGLKKSASGTKVSKCKEDFSFLPGEGAEAEGEKGSEP
jgi:hypothetical protein